MGLTHALLCSGAGTLIVTAVPFSKYSLLSSNSYSHRCNSQLTDDNLENIEQDSLQTSVCVSGKERIFCEEG